MILESGKCKINRATEYRSFWGPSWRTAGGRHLALCSQGLCVASTGNGGDYMFVWWYYPRMNFIFEIQDDNSWENYLFFDCHSWKSQCEVHSLHICADLFRKRVLLRTCFKILKWVCNENTSAKQKKTEIENKISKETLVLQVLL